MCNRETGRYFRHRAASCFFVDPGGRIPVTKRPLEHGGASGSTGDCVSGRPLKLSNNRSCLELEYVERRFGQYGRSTPRHGSKFRHVPLNRSLGDVFHRERENSANLIGTWRRMLTGGVPQILGEKIEVSPNQRRPLETFRQLGNAALPESNPKSSRISPLSRTVGGEVRRTAHLTDPTPRFRSHLFGVDPGHHAAEFAADFFDEVVAVPAAGGLEGGLVGFVLQNPFLGELTAAGYSSRIFRISCLVSSVMIRGPLV